MNSNLAYDDWWENSRDELIDGQIVAMSPRPTSNHNRVAGNIFGIFWTYLRRRPCVPFSDGTDLYLNDKNRFVPDMMVVCDRSKIRGDGIHGAPDLVVEVLSPSTAKNDRKTKKDAYERAGVREYWIVSPVEKSIEQYLLEDGQLTLHQAYTTYPDWMLARMTDEERAAVPTSFQCSLFSDLDIALEDVFYGLLPQ